MQGTGQGALRKAPSVGAQCGGSEVKLTVEGWDGTLKTSSIRVPPEERHGVTYIHVRESSDIDDSFLILLQRGDQVQSQTFTDRQLRTLSLL